METGTLSGLAADGLVAGSAINKAREGNMKSTRLMCMVGMTLFAALATQMAAQDQLEQNKKLLHYSVTNLGTLGGTQSLKPLTVLMTEAG